MTVDELKRWGDVYMKPFLSVALTMLPKDLFAGYLIGYGVSVGRAAGMSEDDLRKALEEAIGSTKPD